MTKRWMGALALGMLFGLAGCATITMPYAEVVGERKARADPHEEDLLIMGVDTRMTSGGLSGLANAARPGTSVISPPKIERPELSDRVVLEPGFRLLRVATARDGRMREPGMATMPLNAKPCMRYYVAAQHESATLVEPWRVVLKEVEPIGECLAKFPDAAAPPAAPASVPG